MVYIMLIRFISYLYSRYIANRFNILLIGGKVYTGIEASAQGLTS